jgi:hypothetical protein
MCFGYVDDVHLIACGESAERNCQTLDEAFQKASAWASKHAAKKFKIIHFERLATKKEALEAITAAENPETPQGSSITVQGYDSGRIRSQVPRGNPRPPPYL